MHIRVEILCTHDENRACANPWYKADTANKKRAKSNMVSELDG